MKQRVHHLPPHLEGQSTWLSKATSARILGHPLVWTVMTAVFIFLGYLWLQYSARPLSERLGQQHADSELIGRRNDSPRNWNLESHTSTKTEQLMPITRQADDQRAEQYRQEVEMENTIGPLLKQASDYMEREAYTGEGRNNAWQSYQAILAIKPEHKLALSGQAQIIGLLQSNAEYAIEEKQYEEAERWLGELDMIEPASSFQPQLRQHMADQISEEVAISEAKQRNAERAILLTGALQDADAAIQATPPKLRVAYDLYQRALELEKQNKAALDGLEAIHRTRISYAEKAIGENDFAGALIQIERLRQTHADEKIIGGLESKLAGAKAEDSSKNQSNINIEQSTLSTSDETDVPETRVPGALAPNPTPASDTITPSSGRTDSNADPVASSPTLSSAQKIETVDIQIRKSPPTSSTSNTQTVDTNKVAPGSKSQKLSQGINAYYAGDYNTAFSRLHPLAEAGSPRAQFRLGIMYYQGRTVVKNEDLARQWIARGLPAILRASQKDQAWAQADLGTAYELGIGVIKDLSRSANLYLKAAKQGYAGAQTNLGVLYGTGAGVKYDRKAAIYWLKKAAIQGDKIAQDNLRILNAR